MTEQQTALARKWVALPGWRWMPGMRAILPGSPGTGRIVQVGSRTVEVIEWDADDPLEWWTAGELELGDVPDVTDPATIGCLVQLVRDITGCSIAVHDPFPVAARGATVLAQVAVYWPRGKTVVASHYRGATVADAALRACLDAEALLRAAQAWEAEHE